MTQFYSSVFWWGKPLSLNSLSPQVPPKKVRPKPWTRACLICLMGGIGTILTAAPVLAVTRSAEMGTVQAEYSEQPGEGCIQEPRLKILRAGQVAFDQVLTGEGLCRQDEEVFAVQDLDGDQEPEVILDFSSGGAHCCSSSLILRYDSNQAQYIPMQHLWGEGYGARRREDLDRDGIPELIHHDSRFAYAFASFAASGMPIRIWQYRQGEMVNVTRNYPKQVFDDAYRWWTLYTEASRQNTEVKGLLAAYLADKHLLGQAEDGWKRLEQSYKASDREQFFAKLREFLVETGYVAVQTATPSRNNSLLMRRPTDPPAATESVEAPEVASEPATPTPAEPPSTQPEVPSNQTSNQTSNQASSETLTSPPASSPPASNTSTVSRSEASETPSRIPNETRLNLPSDLKTGTLTAGEDPTLQVDGTLYEEYQFEIGREQAGQQITITLESTAFDPYLILVDPNQTILAENDDQNTSSQDSRIRITLPQEGIYTVIVNAYRPEGQGDYRLAIQADLQADSVATSPAATPTPTPAATAPSTDRRSSNASEFGTILGTISYPSGEIPALTICAQSVQNLYALNCIKTEAEQKNFRITIRPGEYYIFSYKADAIQDVATGNVRDIFIYYTGSETNNQPAPVRVTAERSIDNITPSNSRLCGTQTPNPAYCVKPPNSTTP